MEVVSGLCCVVFPWLLQILMTSPMLQGNPLDQQRVSCIDCKCVLFTHPCCQGYCLVCVVRVTVLCVLSGSLSRVCCQSHCLVCVVRVTVSCVLSESLFSVCCQGHCLVCVVRVTVSCVLSESLFSVCCQGHCLVCVVRVTVSCSLPLQARQMAQMVCVN